MWWGGTELQPDDEEETDGAVKSVLLKHGTQCLHAAVLLQRVWRLHSCMDSTADDKSAVTFPFTFYRKYTNAPCKNLDQLPKYSKWETAFNASISVNDLKQREASSSLFRLKIHFPKFWGKCEWLNTSKSSQVQELETVSVKHCRKTLTDDPSRWFL